MKLIDRIESKAELKSVRDQIGRVIEARLGSPLKGRKLDEFTADLLGAKDFNTAMGLMGIAESIPKGVESFRKTPGSNRNDEVNVKAWYYVLLGVVKDEYADEADLQDMLDHSVDDFVGTSHWISDNINNQGWERQIQAIASEMALSLLRHRVSEITGITEPDLDECVNKCASMIRDGFFNAEFAPDILAFSVNKHIGY